MEMAPASAPVDEMNESQSSTSSSQSSKTKRIDYEKLEALVGAPRLNDKLAFKVLEISANFTPEVSNYKSGTVIDFDAATNEVTIDLDKGKYNSGIFF